MHLSHVTFWFLARTPGENESEGQEYVEKNPDWPVKVTLLGLFLLSDVRTERDRWEEKASYNKNHKSLTLWFNTTLFFFNQVTKLVWKKILKSIKHEICVWNQLHVNPVTFLYRWYGSVVNPESKKQDPLASSFT